MNASLDRRARYGFDRMGVAGDGARWAVVAAIRRWAGEVAGTREEDMK